MRTANATIATAGRNSDPMMDVPESAAYLGIKPKTMWRYKAERLIPSYRVGRKAIRFKRSDLEAFLEAGYIPAEKPLPQQAA